jgi:hypothetical protein
MREVYCIVPSAADGQDAGMTKRGWIRFAASRWLPLLCGVLFFLETPQALLAEPTAAALAEFQRYVRTVETRLAQQHRAAHGFLAGAWTGRPEEEPRLRAGELVVERLTPGKDEEFDGAMLHHWRGTAFAPGAKAEDFDRLMRAFREYPIHFAPEVMDAKVVSQNGDRMQAWMRVRQRHMITVVMDTSYDVQFGRLDVRHGYSVSVSTRIAEMEGVGTRSEHALGASEEHGFLWRLNTYWSYEERDGGLYVQMETASLTRAIPKGLGWVVRPYVESVPRESVEFTLRSAVKALQNR